MKYYFTTIGLLFFCIQGLCQLDNTAFDQPIEVQPADSGKLALGVNTLGFTKNNEYFNEIADGYTLFGYQVNPYLAYQPLPSVTITLGVYAQKDYGIDSYETIAPTYSVKYVKHNTALIFGTLEGSTQHRLIEPLYDFEKVLIDRLENGMQFKIDNENLFLDGWVDWQHMIYKGDADQEEVTGGLSVDYTFLENSNYRLSLPVQFVVYHQGGQIDDNPNPLKTLVNTAIGFDLQKKFDENSWVQSVRLAPYYVYYKDFSFEIRSLFEDGSAAYVNLSMQTKFDLTAMISYWKGHEFISIQGGQLYPSISSTFKSPLHFEVERELLIFRFFHEMKLTDKLSLTSRFEPFYDLGNQKFEFSHGFYVNYTTKFPLGGKNSK